MQSVYDTGHVRRFKDGERRVYDTERELGAKVQRGVQKAGSAAEHDYDR